jgi:hypothetical protein
VAEPVAQLAQLGSLEQRVLQVAQGQPAVFHHPHPAEPAALVASSAPVVEKERK